MMIIVVTQYINNYYNYYYTVQLYPQLLNSSSLYRYHIEVDKKIKEDNADAEQRSVNWSSYRYL
jgi:hypothetical protein